MRFPNETVNYHDSEKSIEDLKDLATSSILNPNASKDLHFMSFENNLKYPPPTTNFPYNK